MIAYKTKPLLFRRVSIRTITLYLWEFGGQQTEGSFRRVCISVVLPHSVVRGFSYLIFLGFKEKIPRSMYSCQ